MSRESYDDLERSPRQKGGKEGLRLGLILAILIMVILVGIFLYLFLSGESEEEIPAASTPAVSVEADAEAETPKAEDAVEIIVPAATPAPPTSITTVVTPSANVARDISSVSASANANVINYFDYTLTEGENLESVAFKFGLKSSTLISVNKIKNIAAVVEGATIRIPNMDGTSYTVQEGDSLSLITSRFNPGLGYERLQEINGLKNSTIYVGDEIFIPSAAETSQTAASVSAVSFSKPINGSITTNYQERVGGLPINGIGISAPVGTSVFASALGIVADIFDQDLGRFIRLRHEGGYDSVYGPLETVSVSVGDEVTEGQVIGTLGANSLTSPALFFSIEQSGLSLNPTDFLD